MLYEEERNSSLPPWGSPLPSVKARQAASPGLIVFSRGKTAYQTCGEDKLHKSIVP